MTVIRRKCFISYHRADARAVDRFISSFGPGHFIKRGVTMPSEVIDSADADYVMRRIRDLYVRDSTVTIVLVGRCTWARRFVDWEVQSSLRRPAGGSPNGLVAILLDSDIRPSLPDRVKRNRDSGFAQYHYYPQSSAILGAWIEDAYQARTSRAHLIQNPRDRFSCNRQCT